MEQNNAYSALQDGRLLGSGSMAATLTAVKAFLEAGGAEPVLIFEHPTGRQPDFDFQGSLEEVLARAGVTNAEAAVSGSGPGRPRLGVKPREVTLLPRHWAWLEGQPGRDGRRVRGC